MSRQQREAEAAATLRACRAAFAAGSGSAIREAAGCETGLVDWRRYPAGEVYDPATHAQYFLHRHPHAAATMHGRQEHGHFHLFLRGEGVPEGITPLLLPEFAVANAPLPQSAPLRRGARDEVCHLVAVAVDGQGEPVRLFTTNRWVTGETWYRGEDVSRMLHRFRLGDERPPVLLNRWLSAVVRLFQPEIAALLRRRDRVIMERRWRSRGNVLEDPRLEITSSLDINLDARLAAADGVAQSPESLPTAAAARRPPRTAEGWGA